MWINICFYVFVNASIHWVPYEPTTQRLELQAVYMCTLENMVIEHTFYPPLLYDILHSRPHVHILGQQISHRLAAWEEWGAGAFDGHYCWYLYLGHVQHNWYTDELEPQVPSITPAKQTHQSHQLSIHLKATFKLTETIKYYLDREDGSYKKLLEE